MDEKRRILPGISDGTFALFDESEIGTECMKIVNMKVGKNMKTRIVITTFTTEPFTDHKTGYQRQSEVWRGELDILEDNEYLTKISIIAEGQEHPICDIPFALGVGHWMWIPAEFGEDIDDNGESDSDTSKKRLPNVAMQKWLSRLVRTKRH